MNPRSRAIAEYLKAYETDVRYSGANGFVESFDSDMSFAPDDLNVSGAPQANLENISKPYIIYVTNTTAGNLDVVLFGAYRNLWQGTASNWGNDVGLVIATASGVTYGQMLSQSMGQPFDAGQWKITCALTAAQLEQEMVVTYYDANRRSATDPIDINKDTYQYSTDSVVYWYPVKIDGNTELSYTVLGNAGLNGNVQVQIKIYPRQLSIPSRVLIGRPSNKGLATPKIAGYQAFPAPAGLTTASVGGAMIAHPMGGGGQ